jgi:hypothetical protein
MTNDKLLAIEERYKEVWPTAEKLLALILLVKDVPILVRGPDTATRARQRHGYGLGGQERETR